MRCHWSPAVALVLLLSPASIAQSDDATLPEIIRSLRAWRSHFSSIRIDWDDSTPEGIRKNVANVAPEGDYFGQFGHRSTFIWTDWGGVRHESTMLSWGKPSSRWIHGSMGDRPFQAETLQGDPDHWHEIFLGKPYQGRSTVLGPAVICIEGPYVGSDGLWLEESLEESTTASLLRYEERDGVRCAVVELTVGRRRFQMWLDPTHDWLPVCSRTLVTAESGEVKLGAQYVVKEFDRFGLPIWFPKRGAFGSAGTEPFQWSASVEPFQWLVTSVTINESFSRKAMGPPDPHPGTYIYDRITDTATVPIPSPGRRTPATTGATAEVPPSGKTPVVATQPVLYRWIWPAALGLGSVAALFLGFRLRG